jgi:hypothetical protein
MEPEFRRHIMALLKLMIEHADRGGLGENRLSQAEKSLSLSSDVMRQAIEYLGDRGLAHIIVKDPKLRYGVSQVFVTDPGRMYYHQLLEESGQITRRSDLRSFLAWLVSVRIVGWFFASLVFGGYVISLEAALVQSTGFYGGPTCYVILAFLANMVMPIELSIIAWIIASCLLLLGQTFAKPKQWVAVLFGAFNMLLSLWTYGTVGISLSAVHVPWFISFLDLSPVTTLAVIGGVCAIAWFYVVASPFIWPSGAPTQRSIWHRLKEGIERIKLGHDDT